MHVPHADALGIEEWKQEVKKIEENLKALEKKYLDRWEELKVGCFLIFCTLIYFERPF